MPVPWVTRAHRLSFSNKAHYANPAYWQFSAHTPIGHHYFCLEERIRVARQHKRGKPVSLLFHHCLYDDFATPSHHQPHQTPIVTRRVLMEMAMTTPRYQ